MASVLHLLDTNTCIYIIRRRPPEVFERLNSASPNSVVLSVIVALELEVGALRAQSRAYAPLVREWVRAFPVLPLDEDVCEPFARVKADLMARGELIGPMDLLIAAHALALGATLVTNNEREFRRVKGLKLQNWLAAG